MCLLLSVVALGEIDDDEVRMLLALRKLFKIREDAHGDVMRRVQERLRSEESQASEPDSPPEPVLDPSSSRDQVWLDENLDELLRLAKHREFEALANELQGVKTAAWIRRPTALELVFLTWLEAAREGSQWEEVAVAVEFHRDLARRGDDEELWVRFVAFAQRASGVLCLRSAWDAWERVRASIASVPDEVASVCAQNRAYVLTEAIVFRLREGRWEAVVPLADELDELRCFLHQPEVRSEYSLAWCGIIEGCSLSGVRQGPLLDRAIGTATELASRFIGDRAVVLNISRVAIPLLELPVQAGEEERVLERVGLLHRVVERFPGDAELALEVAKGLVNGGYLRKGMVEAATGGSSGGFLGGIRGLLTGGGPQDRQLAAMFEAMKAALRGCRRTRELVDAQRRFREATGLLPHFS